MRSKAFVLLIVVAAVFSSCNRHETPVTGSYGSRVLAGQVVMASDMSNGSPAGVEVSVVGTGMTATLGADGRFTFVGVPQNAELTFTRADGIDGRLRLSGSTKSLVVEVSAAGVKETNSNGGRRRASSKKDPAPSLQYEGTLVGDATADKLVIHDSHGNDVEIALTDTTLIRKGNETVPATDLKDGDRVHVKATKINDVLTASQVIVQNTEGDDDGEEGQEQKEFEGLVVTGGASDSLTIHDASSNQDVTFVINGDTIVRHGNTTVDPATLKEGDRVHVRAKKDGDSLVALLILVQGTAGNGAPTMATNGTVKSVTGTTIVVAARTGDIKVLTTPDTVIKMQGQRIAVGDIKAGFDINAVGTRVDNTTLTAKQIEVHAKKH